MQASHRRIGYGYIFELVALALVVNVEGFVKCSKIFRGNIADCKTLEDIVNQLTLRTSFTGRKQRW